MGTYLQSVLLFFYVGLGWLLRTGYWNLKERGWLTQGKSFEEISSTKKLAKTKLNDNYILYGEI